MTPVSEESPPAQPLCWEDWTSDFERDDLEWDVDIEVDVESLCFDADESGHA
jgi:hypothetical protein